MPVATTRAILKPAGNRIAVVSKESKHNKKENNVKTPQRPTKVAPKIPNKVVQNNVSLDSTCSSDSCSSNSSSVKKVSGKSVKLNGFKPVRVVPDAVDVATTVSLPLKRCGWITPNSGKRACIFSFFSVSTVNK